MSSDEKTNGDHNAEKASPTLIPVEVEHVDQLVLIARDLAGSSSVGILWCSRSHLLPSSR